MEIKTFVNVFEEETCEYTGEVIAVGIVFYRRAADGAVISKEYYEEHKDQFLVCGDCGFLIDRERDSYIINSDEEPICEICSEEYRECMECGEWHRIDDMEYVSEFKSKGIVHVWKYGIAFCGKKCEIAVLV